MILLTVGTQFPFPRLTSALEDWAAHQHIRVVAQVGDEQRKFRHISAQPYFPPSELDSLVMEASLIVSHAGMGSIIGALSAGKRIVVMPRRAGFGEHRNDHQISTAKRFQGRAGVLIAWDEVELLRLLDAHGKDESDAVVPILPSAAPDEFVEAIRRLIRG